MAVDHNNPQSRDEEILIATIDGTEYNKNPQSRMEELLLELKEVIEEGGGGGGTSDYENLSNQPQVNGETLIGDKSGADLGLVDAEEGKGLSTNDYDDTEKAAVSAATSAISAMQDGSDIDSFGDVEVALLDKQDELTAGKYIQFTNDEISVKRDIAYEADEVFFAEQTNNGLHVVVTVGSTTLYEENFVTSNPNHTVLDLVQISFNVRSVRWVVKYLKASKTQSAGYETIIWPSVTDTFVTTVDADKKLIIQSEMDAAINSAVSKCYHHAGTKTCAELLPALLVEANEGNVYEITDSGTTTSDFMEGIGHPIKEGDNVGVARVSDGVYKFDLLSGFVDTSNFVQKSSIVGLIMNDGTIDTVAKQPVTDNNLTTTDKTTTGAINELKSGFTNLDNEVNGDATTYPYADVITIEDAVPANLADCSVKIEPVQDLHGYDKPWVGGAGKNKLPLTVDGIKEASGGTWTGNKKTINSVEFEILTDESNNVTGISAKGTASLETFFTIANLTIGSDECILNGCPAGGGWSSYFMYWHGTSDPKDMGNGVTINDPNVAGNVQIHISSGYAIDTVFYPMIRLATETDATFAPYTNICPITGHTEASVEVTDGDETTKTYTIALGDTIYGGVLDVDSGVMTVDRAIMDLSIHSYYEASTNVYATSNAVDSIKAPTSNDDVANCLCENYEVVARNGLTDLTLSVNTSGRVVIADSRFSSKTDFVNSLNGVHLCYELATPTTIQLTPQQIQLLKGQNTLTASTGDISVTVNGVAGSIGAVQEQVNELAEEVAEIKPVNYSTTEQKTGQKWIDGKDIYCKTYEIQALPNNTTTRTSSGLSNLDKVVKIDGMAYGNSTHNPLPFVSTSTQYSIECWVDDNANIVLTSSANYSTYSGAVTLYYTKTT